MSNLFATNTFLALSEKYSLALLCIRLKNPRHDDIT